MSEVNQTSEVTAHYIYESLVEKMRWTWIGGFDGGECCFSQSIIDLTKEAADLVGYLNFIHTNRIQVLGTSEVSYFERLTQQEIKKHVEEIGNHKAPLIVIADGLPAPQWLIETSNTFSIPLFSSPLVGARVIELLRNFLIKPFAPKESRHGVFLDILGLGVCIVGDSGMGKSELGLELISRGGGLVADDVVELTRIAPNVIEGRCPELLRNLLEVRGIGVLDIRAIFGETAIRRSMRLKLIVHLMRREHFEKHYERIPMEAQFESVMDVPVRKVYLPVDAGRNLSVLIEAAVRNTILQMRGIDTLEELGRRQRELMQNKENEL